MKYIDKPCVCHQDDRVAPPAPVKEGETPPAPLSRYAISGDTGSSGRIKKYVVAHDEESAKKLIEPFLVKGMVYKFDVSKLSD